MKKYYDKSPYKEAGVIAYVHNKIEGKPIRSIKKDLRRKK